MINYLTCIICDKRMKRASKGIYIGSVIQPIGKECQKGREDLQDIRYGDWPEFQEEGK